MGDVRKAFGENLLHHRKRLGLTQAQLAEKVGTTPSYVGHLERGERDPSLVTIEEFSKVLGIAAGEFFVSRQDGDQRDVADQELRELLRDRSRIDLELVIRLSRAAFADPRLQGESSSKEEKPSSRRRGR